VVSGFYAMAEDHGLGCGFFQWVSDSCNRRRMQLGEEERGKHSVEDFQTLLEKEKFAADSNKELCERLRRKDSEEEGKKRKRGGGRGERERRKWSSGWSIGTDSEVDRSDPRPPPRRRRGSSLLDRVVGLGLSLLGGRI
ncbi:hypothetical protein Taro_025903, partial [Colocasia esculenta]|nr:hypothetical protein [Colocasia esculenta]